MSAEFAWDESAKLVDLLIQEQRTLSAVDEFAAEHERAQYDSGRYEKLIPKGLPAAGEQFAFRVDLDACTGCKACVTACHTMNGLEDEEAWRRVGVIETQLPSASVEVVEPLKLDVSAPVAQERVELEVEQQTVTTACHHCEDPGCLAGCPVKAYEKDDITGIVRHLDDQCIGCRYCQLMCPYDVPTYSERLGIVRKCDMCHERLAEGEAPACVQGCPNEAISIKIVEVGCSEPASTEFGDGLLDVAEGTIPASRWTRPTTQYVTADEVSHGGRTAAAPIDVDRVRPSHGHDPLVVMLVLTQAAAGAAIMGSLLGAIGDASAASPLTQAWVATLAALIGFAGLGASLLHIGRPLWAFRAFLGLRTSWLSREIIVLGGFAGALGAAMALSWVDWGVATMTLSPVWQPLANFRVPAAFGAGLLGMLGVYCSVQVYAVTGRPLWRLDRTLRRFFSTAAWAGVAVALFGFSVGSDFAAFSPRATQAALVLLLMAVSGYRWRLEEGHLIQADVSEEHVALARTRRLIAGELAPLRNVRRLALALAGFALPGLILVALVAGASPGVHIVFAGAALVTGLAGDLAERSLFFRAEATPSMPGVG